LGERHGRDIVRRAIIVSNAIDGLNRVIRAAMPAETPDRRRVNRPSHPELRTVIGMRRGRHSRTRRLAIYGAFPRPFGDRRDGIGAKRVG
jgi:hypothetical protein